ncbi:hypothetical protein [Haloparvum sp. AD34]
MTATLELPNGDHVTPSDVFLFNDYPYRYVPLDADEYAFKLSPLVWGGAGMDVPFDDVAELETQWGPASEGVISESAWRDWLADALADERFDREEVDAIAWEVLEPSWRERLGHALGLRDAPEYP